MSTIEATQVLSSATNIAFFVSVFNHTNTAILSLADMGITQAMIDDEKFDLEGGIEDFLYNWAHDQIETTVQLSSSLHLANRETTVDYVMWFNQQVAHQATYKLGELLKTNDYPFVSEERQKFVNMKLTANCGLSYENSVKYRWELAS